MTPTRILTVIFGVIVVFWFLNEFMPRPQTPTQRTQKRIDAWMNHYISTHPIHEKAQ